MCVFEVLFRNGYLWVPFEQVQKVDIIKPKTLRDLYWIQANIELTNGTSGEMFLPALYSGSWKEFQRSGAARPYDRLAEYGSDVFVGEGTRLFWMDGRDKSILDIETIEFRHEQAAEQNL
jgi:type VI secretion system protein ImpE